MKRVLANWLGEYQKFTEDSEAPGQFHFWTGVSVLAGALRRKVWLDMGHFHWFPNFYVFFVAPPGIVNKSTTGSIGMDLLRELGFIHFGPSAGTWQKLIESMTEMREDFELPSGEYMPMTAVTLVVSELGTFIDPQDRLQVDVLVDLWDGKQGVWKKATKKDGDEEIVNPWLNILGFTTPAWIAGNMGDYFAGGGFMSRSIFVYAEKKRKLVAYPKAVFPQDFYQRRENLIHDLNSIASLTGEFTMNEEAYAWGQEWYEKHHKSAHEHLASEKFGGYLARKQTHIHKLAMILSVAESNDLVIRPQHLIKANEEVTKLEHQMPKIFGQMNKEKETSLAADVLAKVLKAEDGTIGKTRLYREFMFTFGYDTFEKIIRSLRHAGWVKEVNSGGTMSIVAIRKK